MFRACRTALRGPCSWDEALFDISGEPRDMVGKEWEGAIAVNVEYVYTVVLGE